MAPMAPKGSWQSGGGRREPASQLVIPWSPGPRWHPPNLIQSVLLVDLQVCLLILLVNLLMFWDWIACELITLFVIFFHAIISPDYRFFFEVPSFEEVQDPNSSPRREEVGRRTLGDYGGLLLPFFYRARFRSFTTPKTIS